MRRLFERYSGRAMTVAMRYVADNEAAKDVLQDGFVKVFTRIGSFDYRGEGSLGGWVLRIIVNESLNYLRAEERFTRAFAELTDASTLADMAEPYEEPDVGRLPDEVLMQLIERLPTGYRTVLNLFVFEQKSHKEIAEALGIGVSTSASQYLRAKKLLAKMIQEYTKKQTI